MLPMVQHCWSILSLYTSSRQVNPTPLYHKLVRYFPNKFTIDTNSFAGILMVLVGQALRSAAMIHASTNFSHTVALHKRDAHRLVTDGVYRSASEVFSFYRVRMYLLPSTTF